MAQHGADGDLRLQRLIRLSDELRELSDLVQCVVQNGQLAPADLLARNRDIVRRCDELALEMSSR